MYLKPGTKKGYSRLPPGEVYQHPWEEECEFPPCVLEVPLPLEEVRRYFDYEIGATLPIHFQIWTADWIIQHSRMFPFFLNWLPRHPWGENPLRH
ncbi:MAG TPA: hypothetical protein VLA04_02710 [Verrucomicrobiae bacterium]|nr:hypothetical protein [Verrucomicrobiae bacterium]